MLYSMSLQQEKPFKNVSRQKILEAVGWAVRKKRRRLSLSQEELAAQTGLHRNYIGGLERGEQNIGFVNLVRLAAALEVKPSELVQQIEGELRLL